MNNFGFDNRSGDNRGSYRRNSGGRDGGRPQLHDAVCDECGKDCKVPFVPSGNKPIFCSECFEKKGGGRNNRSDNRGSYNKPRFNDRDSGRPSRGGASTPDFSQLTRNVETLNKKLDTIISLLGSDKKKKVEKVKVKKEKKVKKVETKKVKDSKPKTKAKVKKTVKKVSPKLE